MQDYENERLIENLKKGEEEAYIYLVDKYHRRLHAYVLTLTDNHTFAQDIVQKVFLKTWQFRKKLNSNFSIQSFLYKSTYNEFVNTYKKDQAVMSLQMRYYESLTEIVEVANDTSIQKMITLVTNEIEKLPPKCRQIFSLSKKEGLSNMEIAEYLGISPKTVENQISKAFKVLRKKLRKKHELRACLKTISG